MSKRRKLRPDLLEVQILEAKPNKMFPDWMTDRLRFLRYNRAVPCAYCGKKTRIPWTMLCDFRVVDLDKCVVMATAQPTLYPPLTPVCGKHPLDPAIWVERKTKK